jgi:sugar lactone lactonase YvrE
MAVAVDDSGRVAITGERSGQLFIFGPDGTLLVQLAELRSPRALGFAVDGTLLVAEPAAARVRRFALERVARN